MDRLRPSAVAVAGWLSLTLGIALNTTMFSTVEGFLLRPLPVVDIGSVVRVHEVARGENAEQVFSMSPSSYVAWREHNRAFDDMAAATGQALTLAGDGDPVRLEAGQVSANFFDLRAELGRTFVEGENRTGNNHVAVMGHRLWERRFGGDPGIVGRDVLLDGTPHAIIGVMPRGFSHPYDAELWTPFDIDALLRGPSGNYVYVPAVAAVTLLQAFFSGAGAGSAGSVIARGVAMCMVAAGAALPPALKAARTPPMQALQEE